MSSELSRVGDECARGAASGEMAFPQIVGRLAEIGVERYHADYSREEITYYLTSGESHDAGSPHGAHETGTEFDAESVATVNEENTRTPISCGRRWPPVASATSCKSPVAG